MIPIYRYILYTFAIIFLITNIAWTQTTSDKPDATTVYRESWALLIGINDYPNLLVQDQLHYALSDVIALKKVLMEQYGFPDSNIKILTNEDATLQNIRNEIGQFTDPHKVSKDDRVLVYFSGHGQTVPLPNGGEMGYILPYDAKVNMDDVKNPSSYYTTCLGMEELRRFSKLTPAKHSLFIMDACYSGLAFESNKAIGSSSIPDYMYKVAKATAQQIITAGGKGEIAKELSELGHGVFTSKLLEGLGEGLADTDSNGVITGSELGNYLRTAVPKIEKTQTPQWGSEGEGEFMFFLQEPTFGILNVKVTPAGSKILINGKEKGQTPAILKLQPGKYRVEIVQDGWVPLLHESVSINRDQAELLEDELKRKMGKLRITSNPPKARVTMDGKDFDPTPNLYQLPTGSYKLKLSKEGFSDYEKIVTIDWKKEVERNINMNPVGMPNKITMAWNSLLLPGLGQYRGKRYISGGIFLLTELTAITTAVVSNIQYNNSVDDYNNSEKDYNNASNNDEFTRTKAAMIKANDNANNKFTFRQVAFVAVGSVWIANAIHALITGPAEGTTLPNEQTKLPDGDIVPQVTPQTVGMLMWSRF